MRAVARWLLGGAAAIVAAAAALWLVLPWLIGPTAPAPGPEPLAAGAFTPARLLASARAGPGGTLSLVLNAAQADALLAAWTASRGAAAAGISAATVDFGTAGVEVHLWGYAPAALPLARLDGRAYEVQALLQPRLPAPGTLDLSLSALQIGRLAVTDAFPPPEVMRFLGSLLGPPAPGGWWRIQGATLSLQPAAAPPIVAAPLELHLVPTALAVGPGTLTVGLRLDGVVALGAATLSQTLAQALSAHGQGVESILQFYPGSAEVTLISPGGAGGGVEHIGLTVDVPSPGLLRIGVAGAAAEGVAAVLAQAMGGMPPWLTVAGTGLIVDFNRLAPFSVGSGVRLRLLPTSAQVSTAGLVAHVEVIPSPAG